LDAKGLFMSRIPLALYVHIPFCLKKCAYCDFNSQVADNPRQIKTYVKSLLADIKLSAQAIQGYEAKTIYLGGGTPSLLDPKDISAIIAELRQCFLFCPDPEITIEVNPATLSREKLSAYKQAGINRISMGVQSFKDKNLKFLGRAHNAKDVFKSLAMLKQAKFDNISIDLIYGLADQSLKDWEDDLNQFLDCQLSHLSLYDLTIEKNTLFYALRDKLKLVDNDLQTLMYKQADRLLTKNKFKHYEISSFAKKGMESKHNLGYWHNQEYLGFGPGAYSYIKQERFSKVSDLNLYQQQAGAGKLAHYGSEILNLRKQLEETLILRLRVLSEFKLEDIEQKANQRIPLEIMRTLNEFVSQGFILLRNKRYQLSKKGLLHYDTIASELLS
jgi:oxygen-independent coproporphyrinogen III oxidase